MIRFDQVSKFYGSVPALRDFSLEAEKGETVVLLGLSGSGKTTTLRMVNGMVMPSSGQVMVRGCDVSDWPLIDLRNNTSLHQCEFAHGRPSSGIRQEGFH